MDHVLVGSLGLLGLFRHARVAWVFRLSFLPDPSGNLPSSWRSDKNTVAHVVPRNAGTYSSALSALSVGTYI
jgi:hypothetical protein